MPGSWNSELYRQRAEAWRQKAASLPKGHEAAHCREIAEEYAELASLLDALAREA